MGQVIYDNLTLEEFLKLPETKPPLEYIQGNVVQKYDHPVIYDGLTLAQFLRLPEAKPALEFVEGKVVQKVSPLLPHTKLEQTLWLWMYRHSIDQGLGECFVELRCTFGGESLVPDIV